MGSAKDISRIDVREQMAQAILDFLSHLPEVHKQAFVWKHYAGFGIDQIADNLHRRPTEVQKMLAQVDLILQKRASSLRFAHQR